MNGEPVEGRNPEPSRTPLRPVTTRWAKPAVEDPGTAGSILPPFRHVFMSPLSRAVPVSPVTPHADEAPAEQVEEVPAEAEVAGLEIEAQAAAEQTDVLGKIIEATAAKDAPLELLEADLTPEEEVAEAWTLPPEESPIAFHSTWEARPESVVPPPSLESPDSILPEHMPDTSAESPILALESEFAPATTPSSEPEPFGPDVGMVTDTADLSAAGAGLELIDAAGVEPPEGRGLEGAETREPAVEEPPAFTGADVELTEIAESIEPAASTDEALELIEVTEPAAEASADEEETWLLSADAVIEEESWSEWPTELVEETATATAGFEGDEFLADDSIGPEEPWDAFGRALKESISWADLQPPDETAELELTEALQAPEPLETSDEEWASVEPDEAESSARLTPSLPALAFPTAPQPLGRDPFADQLADRLQTLASRLRHDGLRAIGDAIAQGDRLEASLALFLAGYRAGRGE